MKKIFFILTGLLIYQNINLANTNAIISSYKINVTFSPDESYMQGYAAVQLERSAFENRIDFYLHGELFIDSILYKETSLFYDETSVFYEYDYSLVATKVHLEIPAYKGEEVEIFYSGHFNPSKASSPSDYMRISKNDGVLLRSYGYSLWYPIFAKDDGEGYKVNFEEVKINTPREYQSVFVGEKIDEYSDSKTRTTVWKATTVDIFDTQCTARKYRVLESNGLYVYYLDDVDSYIHGTTILEFANKIVQDFQKIYRQDKNLNASFYVLEMPKYGDVSSMNVVGISPDVWNNFKNESWAKQTLAHEIVHPFVQIETGLSSNMHAFVIEGFPSYFHIPILEKYLGEEWYKNYIKKIEESYRYKKVNKKHPRGWSLPIEKPILKIPPAEIGIYKDVFILSDRVLLFFDYLRRKMGKDKFVQFSRSVFSLESITYENFSKLVFNYFPQGESDLNIWLKSNDFPEKFYCNY